MRARPSTHVTAVRARPMVLIGVMLALVLSLGGQVRVVPVDAESVLATTPELSGQTLFDIPRELRVHTTREVVLRDGDGRAIPFTGALRDGDVIYPPSLLPGTYVLTDGVGTARFTVETADFAMAEESYALPAVARKADRLRWQTAVAVGAVLILVAALALRRRFTAAAAVALIAALGVGVVRLGDAGGTGAAATYEQCALLHGGVQTAAFNQCAFERITNRYDSVGLEKALDEMDQATLPGCHEIVHKFGMLVWVEADDWREVLAPGKNLCNDAYHHGLLYGASTYATDEQFVELVTGLCPRLDIPAEMLGACYHGVGHGLAVRFGTDYERSVEVCEAQEYAYPQYRAECIGAALMQHSVRYRNAAGKEGFVPKPNIHPLRMCEPLEDRLLLIECYVALAMAHPRTPESTVSASELLAICNGEPHWKVLPCVDGVSREFRSHTVDAGREAPAVCLDAGDGVLVRMCASNVAYFSFDQYRDEDKAYLVCELNNVERNFCSMSAEDMGVDRKEGLYRRWEVNGRT